jgi:hypothetical protein
LAAAFTLQERLQSFVERWKTYQSTEQAGGQSFLGNLLDAYEVDAPPGKLFEQHPLRVKRNGHQHALFGGDAEEKLAFTSERMDMYIPKVVVWEMKSPGEDLQKHHEQVLGYWARTRTRFMVLCNFHEFWIYDTDLENGQLTPAIRFKLADLPANAEALMFLKGAETHFARRPERVTQRMAANMGRLVRELRDDVGDAPRDLERIAKFVLECVFAMFAQSADLIPPSMFQRAIGEARRVGRLDPVYTLFGDFSRSDARDRANRFAPYVNGTLFDQAQPRLDLKQPQIDALAQAASDDWVDVRPEIFGSIFEFALRAHERHELGAHFTREDDIQRVVLPTIAEPWHQRIKAIRSEKDAERVIAAMKAFHILDPACGCGNFLYVAYREMKRLEAALKAAWRDRANRKARSKRDFRDAPPGPYFSLTQVHGIEKNGFAAQLTRVVLWIGEYLSKRELGLDEETLPLKNLNQNIIEGDALFTDWVRPDGELAIIGNPPYLGIRKMRHEFGDAYVEKLFEAFPDNRAADYVTNWYTKALGVLRAGERAGFVSTNSITQNESREVSIDRVVEAGGTLKNAWRSYEWPGEAAVHVSIVNWIMDKYEGIRVLDGREVSAITPRLTDGVDVSQASQIPANEGLSL